MESACFSLAFIEYLYLFINKNMFLGWVHVKMFLTGLRKVFVVMVTKNTY